jgi:hypothetical protein
MWVVLKAELMVESMVVKLVGWMVTCLVVLMVAKKVE